MIGGGGIDDPEAGALGGATEFVVVVGSGSGWIVSHEPMISG